MSAPNTRETAMVGTTFSSYRIESKIGAGGMGVVYKAVDLRLDRAVAIKVLPATALASPDRQKRFVQEAKTASSLNHPSIVTIYDINTQEIDGQPVQYIAMEYVPGETLDKLIGRKGLRVREALKYAIQIADALAAAHAAGIVHRDLKPSNVMVAPQGLVKILDFGLAKPTGAFETDAYAETVHAEAVVRTEEGTILGTVAYMSPEQADGKKIDARSDIFSFGSVLYEMITGKQAFAGSSKMSLLSAVMLKEPQPVSQAAPDVHPELDRIIGRCLKKDPARRWQTMADVKVALEELRDELEAAGISGVQPRTAAQPRTRTSTALVLAGVLSGAILTLAAGAYLVPRFFRDPPPTFQRLTFRRGDVTSGKFASGGAVVYSAEWDGAPSTIYSVIPGNREGRSLQLPNGRVMSVSSTGEMAVLLGTGPSGTLARVPFGGGAPREILENVFYADWGPDGQALAVVRAVGGRYRVEYPVGTVLYENERRPPAYVRVSHDGKLVTFLEHDAEVDYSICIVGSNHPKEVLSRGWRGSGWLNWSPKGDEIWFSAAQAGGDPALYAVDLKGNLRLISQAPGWIVMQDVASDGQVLLTTVNSRLGIMYLRPDGVPARDLAWFDASLAYDLSQDTASLVFAELSGGEGRNAAIYLRKTDGSPAVRLGLGNRPALSPDGKRVVSIYHQPGRSYLALLPTGPGESRMLDVEDMHYESVAWFPDSKRILFSGNQLGHPVRSWMYAVDGSEKPKSVTPEGVRASRVSPDGHSIIVAVPRKLMIGDINGGDPKLLSDLQPGETVVRWSGDGKYIFLAQPQGDTIKLTRFDIASRKHEPWRVVKVPEIGAEFFGPIILSPDGKAVVCTFQHDLANLYLVKGLK